MFHPLEAGVCKLDPMTAQTRVLERVAGDLESRDARPQDVVRRAAVGARLLQARAVHGVRPRRAVQARRPAHRDDAARRRVGLSPDRRAADRVDRGRAHAARVRRRHGRSPTWAGAA